MILHVVVNSSGLSSGSDPSWQDDVSFSASFAGVEDVLSSLTSSRTDRRRKGLEVEMEIRLLNLYNIQVK